MKRGTTTITNTADVDVLMTVAEPWTVLAGEFLLRRMGLWQCNSRLGSHNLSMTGGRVSERIKTQKNLGKWKDSQDEQACIHEKAEKVQNEEGQ